MLGIGRKPAIGLDPTLPASTEEGDGDSKVEEPQDTRPAKLLETRSAKVAPSPDTGDHYVPTTAPSFLTLAVPAAANYCAPEGADGGPALPHGVMDLTPVHRLERLLDGSQGPDE